MQLTLITYMEKLTSLKCCFAKRTYF